MSTFSNVHDVTLYVAQKSTACEGQRLAVVSYRENIKTGVKKDSVCVSIPPVLDAEIMGSIHLLLPAISKMLEAVQDKIVREVVESGKNTVLTEYVDIAACIQYLQDDAKAGRLTKEMIVTWFTDTVASALMSKLMEKGIVEEKKLVAITEEYCNKLAALAGGKTAYAEEISKRLLVCLELVTDKSDIMYARLKSRLESMKQESVDLLAAL